MCGGRSARDRLQEQDQPQTTPEDDPKQRCPDITKARTLLGWEPKIKLEEGLRLSLPFFKEAVAQ